jgi:hypothetical protein
MEEPIRNLELHLSRTEALRFLLQKVEEEKELVCV